MELIGEEVERLGKSRVRKSLDQTKKLQNERGQSCTNNEKLQKMGSVLTLTNSPKSSTGSIPITSRTTVIHTNTRTQWPPVDGEREARALELIRTLGSGLSLPARKVPLDYIRSIEKSARPEARRTWKLQESEKIQGFSLTNYFLNRSLVSLGLNSVVRSLEKDDCVGVLLDKDVQPPSLTQLILPIARSKGIPVLPLNGLAKLMRNVTNIKSIALGLRRGCMEPSSHFHPLYVLLLQQEHSLVEESVSMELEEPKADQDQTPASTATGSHATVTLRKSTSNNKRKKSLATTPFTPVKYRKS